MLLFSLSFWGPGCATDQTKNAAANCTLNLFAAAGTRPVSEELADLFEVADSCRVQRNYAASGTLARQIASGASCDVFISADKPWIDFLIKEDLLEAHAVSPVAYNSLVLIAPADSEVETPRFEPGFDFAAWFSGQLAIGDPTSVPVGRYAKMALDSLGWFDKLATRMVLAKDVNAVLRYVELGECDCGIVYYTEAIQSERVKIVAQIPPGLHQEIVFYVAQLKGTSTEAKNLAGFFSGEKAQAVFAAHGFRTVAPQ